MGLFANLCHAIELFPFEHFTGYLSSQVWLLDSNCLFLVMCAFYSIGSAAFWRSVCVFFISVRHYVFLVPLLSTFAMFARDMGFDRLFRYQRDPRGPYPSRWSALGGTALILAAKEGHAECVHELVEAGANTEVRTAVRDVESFLNML